jgi:nitrogen-specific signal transduction histidine kinase/ActR/RegA family two-component response regulator
MSSDGKVNGGVLTFRDVGEKLKLQEEINKTQKLESIGILAGGIAHDFNNYLTGIIGNISLVMFKISDSDNIYNLLSEAEKAAIRAKDLTQQLLTFAKGGAPIKEQVSIDSLIKDSADFVLRGSKSACTYHFAENLWLAEIDKGQISQVIQNIVLNASQAMIDGGTITILVENTVIRASDHKQLNSGDYLKITITDNGPGISEADFDKIFIPYYSTKSAGHGLGLSICHSILRRHGGDIKVNSETGKGAIFTMYLPATRTKLVHKLTTESDFSGNKEKILFMDDEEMLREFAGSLLENFGYEYSCVEDGTAAISAYQQAFESGSPFDLVIMDLTVPGGMGGELAIKEILKINPAAKAIVSSGYSNHPIMSNYQTYGFKGVIVKPFELDRFFSVLKAVLKG